MNSDYLLEFFERDLNKLHEEISLYKNENDLWILKGETRGEPSRTIKNSAGTLTLHIIGNIKHFIGAQLGNTGYVRQRDEEFSERSVPKENLLKEIDEVITIIQKILPTISDEKFSSEYPIEFLGKKRLVGELLFIIYGHLNYHLGQINYHRRLLAE